MRVESWLLRAARRRPEHPALNGLSYAQLARQAVAGRDELADRGIGEGDRVGIALAPGEAFCVALHACLLLGAVAVPIDLRLSAEERARVVRGAAFVVEEPLAVQERGLAPFLHELDAPAIVVHTSGTSADPKPVELTYGNWLWSALGSAVAIGSRADDRWLCALPLSHVGGLSILVRSAVYGTHAIVHERFDTERVLDELMRPGGATLVSLVPTTLGRLLDAGLERPPALRCALLGGGPVPPAMLERARAAGVPVAQTYGLTEACSQVTTAAPGDGGRDAGPPLFCTRVRVAEDDEVLVAGPTVAPAAAGADGWLATGDLGEIDAEGRLTMIGRKADTIVTGGENVAPTEVEAVLVEHGAVAEAAVHGRADPEWGEVVVATVVLQAGAQVTEEELRAHCAARLASFKVPKSFDFAQRLPRTDSGKLVRRALT